MSIIQPGLGYNVTNSSSGITIDINQSPWSSSGDQVALAALFSPTLIFQPEYVNHYKVYVPEEQIEGSFVLKVAKGGNIWRPVGSDCDDELRADDIITDGSLVVVSGSDALSPWAANDGYIAINQEELVNYYVYAYKVETDAGVANYYIYVSIDGTLDASCPVSIPDGITPPSGTYTVQNLKVATVSWSTTLSLFTVDQHVVGSITWPNVGGEYVNQFQLKLAQVEGITVLKVASGAHIYRKKGSLCDETQFTDTLTPDPSGPSPVDIVTGTGSSYPWAQSDGYVNISAGIFFVFAVKIESASGVQFYLYVTKTGSINDGCPKTIPPGITEPTGDYTVQILQVGDVVYESGEWVLHQNLIGSITWPNDTTETPEQFEVAVETIGEITALKVARGNVYAGNGSLSPNNHDYVGQTLTINHLCYNVNRFAVYPTASVTDGTSTASPWANDNGYVAIDHTESTSYGVFLIRSVNKKNSTSVLSGGTPYLAVMKDSSDATDKTNPWSFQGIQRWVSLWVHSRVDITVDSTSINVNGEAQEPISYGSDRWSNCLMNYNCQRIRIATIYWDGSPAFWNIVQHVKGPITFPHPYVFNGIYRVEYDSTGSESGYPSFFSSPQYSAEQDAWEGSYTGHTKWDGSGDFPTETVPT